MKKNGLFYILVMLMTSCSSVSASPVTPTPEISADASPTSLPANPPPTVQAMERPFSAILARMYPGSFLLMGGTENGEWSNPESVIPRLSDEEMYRTFGAIGPTGSAKGRTPEYDQFCRGYRVETDSYPFGGQAVAVTGDWNVMPRPAQEIPIDHPTYVEVIRDWLIGRNFPEPVVEIDQILRVDLEGDGAEEVLISASHFIEPTGHSVGPGDYSLVLMRKVVGNSAVVVPIIGEYYSQEVENQFPLTYGTLFVADLNNDGNLEILVGVERWEGAGVIVYEVEGTGIQMIYKIICGL